VIKKLSPAELKERRDKGLCFNCDDKFSPGHKCKKLFLIEGIYEEDNERPSEEEARETWEDDELEIPEISLHAISGVQTPQTMRIAGTIRKARVILLADTGSTHNFLNTELAERLGLEPDKQRPSKFWWLTGKDFPARGSVMRYQFGWEVPYLRWNFFLLI
jgi:hypothetical protein